MHDFTEDHLVQKTMANYLHDVHDWRVAMGWNQETFGPEGTFGRKSDKDTVLTRYLSDALVRLNPGLPDTAYELALREITDIFGSQSLLHINQDKYVLIRDGVRVKFRLNGEQRTERLRHFVSRVALDIEGLGERTIAEFFALGWLESPADIFRLNARRADILGREGWKDKSVDNLLTAIEAKRSPDGARLLFGLGIRHVGAVTARDLLKRFATLPRLRDVAERAHGGDEEARAELIAIDGIGPAVVEALGECFHGPPNGAGWGGLVRGVALYAPLTQVRLGDIALRFDAAAVVFWAVLLLVLGLLSAVVAARRVLAIDPIEATTGGGGR